VVSNKCTSVVGNTYPMHHSTSSLTLNVMRTQSEMDNRAETVLDGSQMSNAMSFMWQFCLFPLAGCPSWRPLFIRSSPLGGESHRLTSSSL